MHGQLGALWLIIDRSDISFGPWNRPRTGDRPWPELGGNSYSRPVTDIRATVELAHPPRLVWRALTDHRLLCDWFMPTTFVPRKETRFQFRPTGLAGFSGPIDAEISHLDPPTRLTMQWRGDQLHSQVVWELEPTASGTRLTVEHTGFLGLNGHQRRRHLLDTYAILFGERLPAAVDRLAGSDRATAGTIPRQRPSGSATEVVTGSVPANSGRWRVLPVVASSIPAPAPAPVEETLPATPAGTVPLPPPSPPSRAGGSDADPAGAGGGAASGLAGYFRGQRRRQILAAATGALLVVFAITVAGGHGDTGVPDPTGAGAIQADRDGRVSPDPPGVLSSPVAPGGPTAGPWGTPDPASSATPAAPDPNPTGGPLPGVGAGPTIRVTEEAVVPGAGRPLTARMTVTGGPLGKLNLAKYRAVITIANPGTALARTWAVALTIGERQAVDAVTGATYARSGTSVILTPSDSNQVIPPGGSITVTFDTSGVLAVRPRSCTIDDRPCS